MKKNEKILLALAGLMGVAILATAGEAGGDGGDSADVDYRDQDDLPRGLRNNNPGNIKYNAANNWQGQVGSDGTFAIFSSYKWGIRAMMKLLMNYYNNNGLRTVRGIVSKWAPAGSGEGNPTNAYINKVANEIGVHPDDQLAYEYNTFAALVISMAAFETGIPTAVSDQQTKQVWREFFEGVAGTGTRRMACAAYPKPCNSYISL